jgi:hypothetical protein
VLSAVRSNEAAVEDEDDVFVTFVAGESYLAAFAVAKLEVGGGFGFYDLDVAHSSTSLPIVRSLARFLRMSMIKDKQLDAVNPLNPPVLGDFIKMGDTPISPGRRYPAPQRPLRLRRFPLFIKEGARGSSQSRRRAQPALHPKFLSLEGRG